MAAVVLLVVSCSEDGFDRDRAIADAVEASAGRWSDEQAACYVDRVVDELGRRALDPQAGLGPEEVGRVTTIRVDCVGVANLAAEPPDTTAPPDGATTARPPPERRDPERDRLREECAAGYGASCDELFDRSGLGSGDERFAATCGGRSRELRCADVYPEPGVVRPSPAQPTTTEPPAGP